jgi:general secretion pathway protein M
MEQLKAQLANLQGKYQALNAREKRLVLVASAALVAFVLFVVMLSFSSSAAGYRRRIESKGLKLKEAQALADSYQEADRSRRDLERELSQNQVQLISYLEEKGAAAGLDIPTLNPKGDIALADGQIIESSVELTLTDVPVQKFHAFLSNVERGPGVVKVKYLRLEPRPANQTLTAWATIATYRSKQ